MAIKLLSVNGISNSKVAEYIVDLESEKDNVPIDDKIFGTRCFVCESGKRYRLDSGLNWVEEGEDNDGGGTAPSVIIQSLTVTQNGTSTAPQGRAYSPVIVNVANSYAAGDEGKVVSDGALIAQTAHAKVTEDGVIDTTYNSSVEIAVASSLDPVVEEKDVNFIDYDGTIVYSYTTEEFAQLNSLPENPSHEGLVAQGWNWALSDAKSQVANSGILTIGQNYTTSDGATKIKIELEEEKLSPYLHLWVTEGVEATIDWGDDSEVDTIVGVGESGFEESIFTLHNYQTPGEYIISINSEENGAVTFGAWGNSALLLSNTDFKVALSQDSYYVSAIKEINLSPVCKISYLMCDGMLNLEKISLPNNAEIDENGGEQFGLCYSLKGIVLPSNIGEISNYMFANCVNLTRIAIPYQITSYGNKAFNSCYLLKKAIIVDNVTTIGTECFKSCEALEKIYIPSSITSYPTSFLEHTFSLPSLTIGSNVTSLGSSSLASSSFGELHFKSTNPPTAIDNKVFSRLLSECIIYVPSGRRTTYMSTTNYPNPNEYTYIEEA